MNFIGAVVVVHEIIFHHCRSFQQAAFGVGLPVAL